MLTDQQKVMRFEGWERLFIAALTGMCANPQVNRINAAEYAKRVADQAFSLTGQKVQEIDNA